MRSTSKFEDMVDFQVTLPSRKVASARKDGVSPITLRSSIMDELKALYSKKAGSNKPKKSRKQKKKG